MKERKRVPPAIKARLQKEINSECPFCSNEEVECFHIHHIDEAPTNNDFQNLILLCPTCHDKVTRTIITHKEVQKKKANLALRSWKVEFVSVTADNLCDWKAGEESEFAFFNRNRRPKNPVLNFTFINHLPKTVVLKALTVRRRSLYSGMSGPPPEPEVLYPLAKYHVALYGKEAYTLRLENPLAVPAQKAFLFQVELSEAIRENARMPFSGRKVTQFTFSFSNGIIVNTPMIHFNCNSEDEGITIVMQS